MLAVSGRTVEARACFAEAIGVLSPAFLALPEAHFSLMAALMETYQRLNAVLGQAPDAALLGPVLPVLEKLRPPDQ